MESTLMGQLILQVKTENWPYIEPFRITGHMRTAIDVILVTLEKDGRVGRGEASGVRYRRESAASMVAQIEAVRREIEAGLSRERLQAVLPPGGARNAVDCALWDLEAKLSGRPAWQAAGLEKPRPLLTTFTCGADAPFAMAAKARSFKTARAIKIKLTGEEADADRVRAVREAREDVRLCIDANQGFTRSSLERLMPVLIEARVELIEQPFPIGQDALLDGFESPIPLAADESVQSLQDMAGLERRYQMVNIKLDKCGGLTEALAMARAARAVGLESMVGNMGNTSLAMAPAFLAGQLCTLVDLDGPILLRSDRADPVQYIDGYLMCPEELWGHAEAPPRAAKSIRC